MERYIFFHFSEVLNTVLFITSGLLTLCGLLSFFGSLNLQQKIERAGNILERIELLDVSESNDLSKEVFHLFSRYERIIKSDDKPEKYIITCIRIGISVVIISWTSLAVIAIPIFFTGEWIYMTAIILAAIVILIYFYRIVGKVLDINYIGSLPRVEELLDLSNAKNIHLLNTVIAASKVKLDRREDTLDIYVGFPLTFENVSIGVSGFSYNNVYDPLEDYIYIREGYEENYCTVNKEKFIVFLGHPDAWYKVYSCFDVKVLKKYLDLQFDFSTKNGHVVGKVQYELNELNGDSISIKQLSANEYVRFQESDAIPFSSLSNDDVSSNMT